MALRCWIRARWANDGLTIFRSAEIMRAKNFLTFPKIFLPGDFVPSLFYCQLLEELRRNRLVDVLTRACFSIYYANEREKSTVFQPNLAVQISIYLQEAHSWDTLIQNGVIFQIGNSASRYFESVLDVDLHVYASLKLNHSMEQFRQIGEVLGSLKALMVFKDNIQINRRQCILLHDILSSAYDVMAEEMRQNLRFEEKNTKWKILEGPLKDLRRIFKEGEGYIRQCLEPKNWWAKVLVLYRNKDCTDFHIHNLLCEICIIIEAIESVGEISGWDQDETRKKKVVYSNKYRKEYKDLRLFRWKFGKQYLITQDFCNEFSTVLKEDQWVFQNKLRENKIPIFSKYEQRLSDHLLKNLDESESLIGKLLAVEILVGHKDYHVKRRLGTGSQYKEIFWLGEGFALRHFFGDIESLLPEISSLLTLSHPNIMQILVGFTDSEKKECFLVKELMSKDLLSHIKEICGPRKKIPFSLPVAVDLMLQIARGMEYLHSKQIYHGKLTLSKILVKARDSSTEGYLHAKVSGFGLNSVRNFSQKNSSNGVLPFIWYAPEVLEEQERTGSAENSRFTEKSDVYSFAMLCIELLTGKVPFEDGHLQGDKMSRNIRAGERPLFPLTTPKFLTNLAKKCWHTDPNQRPSFSSICRILRYIKHFLSLNPDHTSQTDFPMPILDYCDIESGLLKEFSSWDSHVLSPISDIPFQLFLYKIVEREKAATSLRENSESGSDGASACGDEMGNSIDGPLSSSMERSLTSLEGVSKKLNLWKKSGDTKAIKLPGTPTGRLVRPPQMSPRGRTLRINSESQLMAMSPRPRRTSSGHASDSELS